MSSAPIRDGSEQKSAGAPRPNPDIAWSVIGPAGLMFTFLALVDLTMIWFPARLDDGLWAVNAVNAVMSGMPLLAVGLVLGYAAAMARGLRSTLRFWSTIMVLVAVALVFSLGLYLFRIPAALSTAESVEARSGITEAAIRTGSQAVLYLMALFWLGIKGLLDRPSY
jgi:chromate transport protein ChrA